MRKILIGSLATILMSGCTHVQSEAQSSSKATAPNFKIGDHSHAAKAKPEKPHVQVHREYKPYNAAADSMVDIDQALARARVRGTKVMVVMGANWCHDSRGFAARMDKPEFRSLIKDNYEIVYVSAGTDPGQKDQNRVVSKRFGVDAIEGTPTIFITKPDGTILNTDSAGYWRRADSIPTDMSYAYFDMYAGK